MIAANQQLMMERDSTYTELSKSMRKVDSMSQESVAMSATIKKASIVKATDIRGEAVIIRSNGKVVDTKRSSRADKIRTCFTLTPNEVAQTGDRILYVQVINPKNSMMGENVVKSFDNMNISYSASTNVFYENEALDVCILVNANEADLIQGRYTINLFDGPNLIGSANMELK